MDPIRLGVRLRVLRVRQGLRQVDVAEKAKLSRRVVGRIENGDLEDVPIRALEAHVRALDAWMDVLLRWRGTDLERLLDQGHAALQERIAALIGAIGGWEIVPEASFSIYGERGSVDLLCWHAASRTLLVVEIKTELVDVQATLAGVDRKRRLAPRIAAERGWEPRTVAAWLVFADSTTNRRHVSAHSAVLRRAFPAAGRAIRSWLPDPTGPLAALSFVEVARDGAGRALALPRRVQRRSRHCSEGVRSPRPDDRTTNDQARVVRVPERHASWLTPG